MKLGQVSLENFGPFFGSHEIDLSVTTSARVIVIHGENERGKTSLSNAIRWCLYRQAIGRNSIAIPTSRLLNADAKSNGLYNVGVTLDFEHSGSRFQLERHAQAARVPSEDRDFEFHTSLRRNGNFENEGSIERTIREILHPQIARFFLFDGEMLNEYEDLLRDQYRRAEIVKQSIEQILGLPSIQSAVGALAELKRGAERSQLSEARARRENEKLIAQAQQKEEELSALEKDIRRHEEIKATLEAERNDLRQQMETFGEVRADLRELDRLEKSMRQIEDDSATMLSEIRSLLKESWWLPLEVAATMKSRQAESMARESAEAAAKRGTYEREIVVIDKAMADRACDFCGHQLSDEDVQTMGEKRANVVGELGKLGKGDSPSIHFEMIAMLRPFVGRSAHADLRTKEGMLRRLGIRKRQEEAEAVQIRERVKRDYRAEISQVERNLEKCLGQIRDAEKSLADSKDRRDLADSSLQRLQLQIRRLPSANRGLAIQAALYDALREVFDSAIEEFRQKLREDVEREASDIHRALTADPGYGGLKINEQFGLSLLNDRGRVITDRSAGSEQIVALSLIGALNRCTTKEGPVVMDTPFGRLDRRHRANILKFAPQFGTQVVLLVQSGELERERDLQDLRPCIAREYRIERDGASDRSRIVEIA